MSYEMWLAFGRGLALSLSVGASLAWSDDKLSESADDGRVYSVRCRLKVEGQIQTAGVDGKVLSLKTNVDAKLSFLERRLPPSGRAAEALRSVRFYDLAEADITVAERKTINRLDEKQRVIVAEGRADGVRVYSHGGGMTYEGVELLRTPGDSLMLLPLLPTNEVKLGAAWQPDPWVLPALTGVEAVSESTLNCKLDRLDSKFAVVTFDGKITGAILGALTTISVKGQVAYDVAKQHIRQAVLTQTEERAVGAVSPGMKVTATMYVDKAPSGVAGPLTDRTAGAIPLIPEPHQLALSFDAPSGSRFAFNRNWHVFHQAKGVAVLRLIDSGALIAQCNVSQVPTVAAGQKTPPEQFQADIRTALGSNLKELMQVEQAQTDDGIVMQRVIAVSQIRDIPMHSIYYLCTAPDGRQVAFAFSVESRLLKTLADRDRALVESTLFTQPRTAKK